MGSLVSPAVMAILSVPPSTTVSFISYHLRFTSQLTSKRSRDKNRGKATNTSNERCTRDMPIFSADVLSHLISTTIDNDSHDDENYNGDDF